MATAATVTEVEADEMATAVAVNSEVVEAATATTIVVGEAAVADPKHPMVELAAPLAHNNSLAKSERSLTRPIKVKCE